MCVPMYVTCQVVYAVCVLYVFVCTVHSLCAVYVWYIHVCARCLVWCLCHLQIWRLRRNKNSKVSVNPFGTLSLSMDA